jgi:hypothetical protein
VPNTGVVTFNTGEVSPLLAARVDLEKYLSSCRILENMFPTVYGAAVRRPGYEMIAPARFPAASVHDDIQLAWGAGRERFIWDETKGCWVDPVTPTYCIGETAAVIAASNTYWATQYTGTKAYLYGGYPSGVMESDTLLGTYTAYWPGNIAPYGSVPWTSDTIDISYLPTLHPVRMIGFIYSAGLAFMCEFGHGYIRFFQNGALTAWPDIATTYAYADLPALQTRQQGNTMWITGKGYAPAKLVYDPATGFTLTTIPFTNGPFLVRNDLDRYKGIPGVTMQSSVTEKGATGVLTIIGGGYTFQTGHVGAMFQLTNTRTNGRSHLYIYGPGTSASTPILIKGTYNLMVGGSWFGTVSLQRSENGGVWENVKTWTSDATSFAPNINYSDVEHNDDVLYNVTTTITSGTVTGDLTVDSTVQAGIVQVVAILTPTTATITVIEPLAAGSVDFGIASSGTAYTTGPIVLGTLNDTAKTWRVNAFAGFIVTVTDGLGNPQASVIASNTATQLVLNSTGWAAPDGTSVYSITHSGTPSLTAGSPATSRWAEGAWSTYRGFPRAVTFHEGRVVYAGTDYQPQTLWLSAVDNFEDFGEDVKDADPFSLMLATGEAILWLDSLDSLAVGTTGNEWRVASTKLESALTPTNFNARVQSTYGAAAIQPSRCDMAVLYVDYVTRKLREFTYSNDKQQYVAPDLTQMAEHVTLGGNAAGGITAIALQRNPDKVLWAVRGDGVLLSLTYERAENVVAWARHPMLPGLTVESVAVIPGAEEDEVWLAVAWQGLRYVCRMASRLFTNRFFVDLGKSFTGTAQTSFTGLDYLDGQTVQIVGDNAVYPPAVVSNGTVAIPGPGVATAYIGLPSTYTLQPMRLQVPSRTGDSQGSIIALVEAVVSLYNTSGARYGMAGGATYLLTARDMEPYGTPPALFTGEVPCSLDDGFTTDTPFIITGSDPLPCVVRSIIFRASKDSR